MTTLKILAVAGALSLAPGLAIAMGCNGYDHKQQAQRCIAGTTWDAEKSAGVPIASG